MKNKNKNPICTQPEKLAKEKLLTTVKEAIDIARYVEEVVAKDQPPRPSREPTEVISTKLTKDEVLKSMDNSIELKAAIQEKVKDHVFKKMRQLNVFEEQAEAAFTNFTLSRVSEETREEKTYLQPNANVKEVQEAVYKEDFNKMAEVQPTKGFKVNLSPQEMRNLGLQVVDGQLEGQLQSQQVMNLLKTKGAQGELTTNSHPAKACMARKRAQKMVEEATSEEAIVAQQNGAQNVAVAPNDVGVGNNAAADQLIKQQVDLQMEKTTSPESQVIFEPTGRASQEDVTKNTKTFNIAGGPADVTAYHDFYDLQIAFRHVWTELFDENVVKNGKALTAELMKLKDYVAKVPDRINSVDELKQLKDDLHQVYLKIAEQDPRLGEIQKLFPSLTVLKWSLMDETIKATLYDLTIYILANSPVEVGTSPFTNIEMWLNKYQEGINNPYSFEGYYIEKMYKSWLDKYEKAKNIIENLTTHAEYKKRRVEILLEDMEQRLREKKYVFDVFAKDSVNYGILVNYRQKWEPLSYQVGELVSTLPLAPKETRKYTKKRIVKKSRAVKEIENSLQMKREESTDTYRLNSEIVRKAMNKTNFNHTAEGGVNFAVWNAKGSHSLTIDTSKHSAQTKREFREAVMKAAQEYKNENRLEVSTTGSETFEESSSGEITNPNDELAVTYLFYELQRRFEISEKIRKLTPIVLIANEVPRPHEIDEDWLMTHDWILRRAILDDSFLPALDYLSENFVGDEIAADTLRKHLEIQIEVVQTITQQLHSASAGVQAAQLAGDIALNKYANTLITEDEGFIESVGKFLGGGDDDDSEEKRVRLDYAKDAFQRAERIEKDMRARLGREVTTLERATTKYTNAIQLQFNKKTEILRLRAHVKDNILYYMQAIWDQEPPDQRFFRLYNKKAPEFQINPGFHSGLASGSILGTGAQKTPLQISYTIPGQVNINYKTLVEIADIDNLLGYKGNYMIFPLKENNPVTLYMMQGYMDLDEMPRLWDPDEAGNYTIEEMKELITCYYKEFPDRFTDEVKKKYRDLMIKRLMDPHPDKEVVIVPTDSLYIESLPGKHPILEDYKLIHRAVDVKKVQAEVRHDELENVRLAARVLKGKYGDPEVDKKVIIEGDAENVLAP